MKLAYAISQASLGRFIRDEDGTTAIEYALIAAGISIAIAASAALVGSSVAGFFQNVASAFPGP